MRRSFARLSWLASRSVDADVRAGRRGRRAAVRLVSEQPAQHPRRQLAVLPGAADGRYAERVYDHVVNGVPQFEVHLGPRREFAIFTGVQDEHREHDSADNLLKPFRVPMEGTRAPAALGNPVAEAGVHGHARRRLAHRLRELVHPPRAAREDLALDDSQPHSAVRRLSTSTDRPSVAADVTTRRPTLRRAALERLTLTISVIVCAYNEARSFPPVSIPCWPRRGRPTKSSSSTTRAPTRRAPWRARSRASASWTNRPRAWSWRARPARRAATGDILAYVDADCRAPLQWLERIERRFDAAPALVAVTGPYRFYDWDCDRPRADPRLRLSSSRRRRTCSCTTVSAPARCSTAATSPSGATRSSASAASIARIEFHGEDTNLGRRLTPLGTIEIARECWVWTSARRYRAMGKRKVFGLYVRNFWSEILRHRPADRDHLDVRA